MEAMVNFSSSSHYMVVHVNLNTPRIWQLGVNLDYFICALYVGANNG